MNEAPINWSSPRASRIKLASVSVESFGLGRLQSLTVADIASRYEIFRQMSHFEIGN
jgi:hypothetical protein